MAYIGPVPLVEPANTTPLAKLTGPLAVALLGFAVDHKMFPFVAFIDTHPPLVVVIFDGFRVNVVCILFAMFV